ncbi:MAG: Disulfide-bond oxidoreductase YfcG [Chroococcopsis gigantea SAG 12.99]|jgi:glutathione S-transferase|nr:glutathione S-transferase family protein [Chlorogloea purpurea SAG 13.99]MDV3000474.1 Disulfide-bond oxidoreductase YfcG [Chroococcopsis gigantea SAG 12.99]
MIKVYGGARSRASIVLWYLEELGIPYEFLLLDMDSGEHRRSPFTDINPFGKVPAIDDDGFTLWESGAILLYLAEKYGGGANDLQTRSIYSQWVLFGNSTLATGLFVEASREKEMPKLLTPLNEMLGKHPYLLGDDFTVADVAVGSILAYVPMMLKVDLSPYPSVLAYIERLSGRPSFIKAILGR